MRTIALYLVTALAEIIGCYLPWLWLRHNGSVWWLVPAAASLAAFAWLLTLHDSASGRVYAAYGGGYIGVGLLLVWGGGGIPPSRWGVAGGARAPGGAGHLCLPPPENPPPGFLPSPPTHPTQARPPRPKAPKPPPESGFWGASAC